MTIKKRLLISNIMMILVPALIATCVGVFCVEMASEILESQTSFGLNGKGDFYSFNREAMDFAEDYVEDYSEGRHQNRRGQGGDKMRGLAEANEGYLGIYRGEQLIYETGSMDGQAFSMIQSLRTLGGGQRAVTAGGKIAFLQGLRESGEEYSVVMVGPHTEGLGSGVKIVLAAVAALLLIAISLAVWLTNRIMTRFVFRKIEEPISRLAKGADEIGRGNLDYRLLHGRNDEFKPVCDAFNDMAVRLKASVEQSKRNEEGRKELIAGISHDVRSPLTSIKAYVEGLMDEIADTPESRRKYLETIRRKTDDIDRMVTQMLAFSKLDMEGYRPEMEVLRLDAEVDKLVDEWREDYRNKGLEIEISRKEPCEAKVDKAQFAGILRNVLDNSAKYKKSEVGRARIEVFGSVGDEGRSQGTLDGDETCEERLCTVRISDDGQGVEPETLGKLFDAFYRTDPARKNPAGGSGLGLAIVAKAVARMGGSVNATPSDMGGLTIEIRLARK